MNTRWSCPADQLDVVDDAARGDAVVINGDEPPRAGGAETQTL